MILSGGPHQAPSLIHNQGCFWVIVSNSLYQGYNIITEKRILLVSHFSIYSSCFTSLLPLCLSTLLAYFSISSFILSLSFLTIQKKISLPTLLLKQEKFVTFHSLKSNVSVTENFSLLIQLFQKWFKIHHLWKLPVNYFLKEPIPQKREYCSMQDTYVICHQHVI